MPSNNVSPIASLDMYAWPETKAYWETFWRSIRSELDSADLGRQANVPVDLAWNRDIRAVWSSPDLFVGHTCGWPYVSELRNKVTLIGRFDHQLEGCAAGDYDSILIVRNKSVTLTSGLETDDLSWVNSIAVNGLNSQSGYRVLSQFKSLALEKIESKQGVIVTGSHRDSIKAVGSGQADLASIDAVTWRLAKQHERACENVNVIARSRPTPGLPIITSNENAALKEKLFEAVSSALNKLDSETKEALGCYDFVSASDGEYEVLV